jgi:hypothetical protein
VGSLGLFKLLVPAFALLLGLSSLAAREEPIVWPFVSTGLSTILCVIFYLF